MTPDLDVLILGGGCAGLSLATALAQHAPALRVGTLEQRTHYTRDRTWCFWNTAAHPFTAGVTHRWPAWRVRAGAATAVQRSTHYRYEHLPADRFYALATETLQRAGQQLCLGVAVQGVRAVDNGTSLVDTSRGTLRARWVFDARPPAPAATRPVLWQRFTGWHVRTARPCFDPGTVDLMDFQPGTTPGRTAFFYVLPFSATEALVETTFFDAAGLPAEDAEPRLRAYLEALCPEGWEVLYREAAALPMGGVSATPDDGVTAGSLGIRGGRLKPSSGYGFLRIQRQSDALARALGQGAPLPRRFEPRYYEWLDRIFLAALQRHPERTPAYFLRLFQRVPADRLVPFLSETARLPDVLAPMLALPRWDFLRAALALPFPEAA